VWSSGAVAFFTKTFFASPSTVAVFAMTVPALASFVAVFTATLEGLACLDSESVSAWMYFPAPAHLALASWWVDNDLNYLWLSL